MLGPCLTLKGTGADGTVPSTAFPAIAMVHFVIYGIGSSYVTQHPVWIAS